MGGRAVERQRDLATDVDARVIVVAPVGCDHPVTDEDHLPAHLAARRAAVGRPLPPDLQRPDRGSEALEGGPRPHDDARREREGLDEAPGVATRPEPHRGEPIGEIASGALAAGRAGGASLHIRRRERAHVSEEIVGDRRGCRAPRRGGDRREEEDSQREEQGATSHGIIVPLLPG
jgi:hypothetical protein